MDRDKISRNSSSQSFLRRSAPRPLTTTAIAALKPGRMLADGAVRPGAGSLKVRKRSNAHGVVTEWLFEWNRDGKTTRQSIGRYSVLEAENGLTLPQARAEAARLQATIKAGEDPTTNREIEREAAKLRQATIVAKVRDAKEKSLSALVAAYVVSLRSKGKHDSAYDTENAFSNHVEKAFPDLALLPAASVTPEHISRILARLVGPDVQHKKGRTALKLRSYMAAAFKLALGASTDPMAPVAAAGFGLITNPAAAVPATTMAATFNRPGERTLSPTELRHFLAHVAALPSSLHRLALQLQITSGGQRMQQLLRLRHSDVNALTFTLYDPKGRRSQPRTHVLPLIPEVDVILDALREVNPLEDDQTDGLLFTSRRSVIAPETLSGAVQNISDAMVETKLASAPFRGGDIRRTVETMLAETLGVSKDTRAQLLSHGLTGVQDRHYDKGLHLAAKTAALRAWNDYVADLCIGTLPVEEAAASR